MALVGGNFVEVLNAPTSLSMPLFAGVILDSAAPEYVQKGDFLLAVGLRPGDPALNRSFHIAAEAGAVIACKVTDDEQRAALLASAKVAGVVAVAVAPEMSWDSLYTLVRTAIASSFTGATDERGVPFGDMFAVANAASATLEGPVVINDERMEVIAFSNLEGPIDDLRRRSILQRHPPRDFMDWCSATGLLSKVRQSRGPVRVTPPGGDVRLVIAIKAGSDILGYIWVSEKDREFDQSSTDALTEIARVAALQLLRSRINENLERRLRSDLFRSALDDRGSVAAFASRIGFDLEQKVRLVAFRAAGLEGMDSIQRRSVQDLISLRIEGRNQRGAVSVISDVVYLVLQVTSATLEGTRVMVEEMIGQCERQLRLPLQAAIGAPLDGLGDLFKGRRAAERLLSIISRDGASSITTHDEMRAESVLAEIVEVMNERAHLLAGGVAALDQSDETKGTEYLNTLQVYFDAGGDLSVSAKKLFLHRNTLKYRLGRIYELFDIDLNDPIERLVAELQVRAISKYSNTPRRSAAPGPERAEEDPLEEFIVGNREFSARASSDLPKLLRDGIANTQSHNSSNDAGEIQ